MVRDKVRSNLTLLITIIIEHNRCIIMHYRYCSEGGGSGFQTQIAQIAQTVRLTSQPKGSTHWLRPRRCLLPGSLWYIYDALDALSKVLIFVALLTFAKKSGLMSDTKITNLKFWVRNSKAEKHFQ